MEREIYLVNMPIDYIIPPKKDKACFKMHKYWASKPWYVVNEYIKHFTKKGDIVLDPFCGSGVVGVEALANKRKVVLNDLNPMATFITKNTCYSPVDLDAFWQEFLKIKRKVKQDIMNLYLLRKDCKVCGGSVYAKHVLRGPALKGKWIVEGRCSKRHGRSSHVRRYLTYQEIKDIYDIESKKIPYRYPNVEFPDGKETMRLKKAGINKVSELFTRRNLLALSILWENIQKIDDKVIRDLMVLAFSNSVLHVSKLKSEKLRPMSANSYYCMKDWIEENVWMRFENRVKWHWGVVQGKNETNCRIGDFFRPARGFKELQRDKTFYLLNKPAQDLKEIPDRSIDYCFTDPPYGGSIQYMELTFLWRAWLNMYGTDIKEEITINKYQHKNEENFGNMLSLAFSQIYRVMKPGKWLSVTFNNRDLAVWHALMKSCQDAGFEKVNIVPQKPVGNSFVQSWSAKSLKRDLVINFKKPKYRKRFKKYNTKTSKKHVSREDIIIKTAKEHLNKVGKATLSELFEVITVKWINYFCENTQTNKNDKMENLTFDMDYVDKLLSSKDNFHKSANGGIITLKLSQIKPRT